MVLNFKRLWKLLIDRNLTRTEMRLAAGISASTLAKLSKGEAVNTAILVKICDALNCSLEDIVEYHPLRVRKSQMAKVVGKELSRMEL